MNFRHRGPTRNPCSISRQVRDLLPHALPAEGRADVFMNAALGEGVLNP